MSGRAETVPVEWLVDTGCTTTVLAERVFNQIPEDERPDLMEYPRVLLSADDTPIKVIGQADLNIKLGTKLVQHRVIVAEVSNQGMLGMDFLRAHNMVLNFATGHITCEGEEMVTRCQEGITRVCRVSTAEKVVIPANSRTVIQGRSTKPLACGSWLVEPLSKTPGNKPVLTAKALVKASGTSLPIEVMNPTDEDVVLYQHTNLGLVHRVKEPDVLGSLGNQDELPRRDEQSEKTETSHLPPELNKILEGIEVSIEPEQRSAIEQFLRRNQDVFATAETPFGRTTLVKHEIVTTSEKPIKQSVRRTPLHLREAASQEVKKMLKSGVIEPSNSPWASPVVLVRKKDGSLRYCIDYRKLNSVTLKDSYPLPRIDESLDSLGNAKYFSTLDLASGYWQIALSEDAKTKSAFCTTSGLYQFCVMPFGLTNAPATFQRLMERVLAGLQWQTCLVYIDDIIIFSRTVDEHLERLNEVFSRLRSAQLRLKPKKCTLFRKKVKYLGHEVSETGIETDPEKIAAVQNWPRPKDVSDVRSFMGLCSYYRRFVPNFATKTKPLVRLTEKNSTFDWSDDQEEAFKTLKMDLAESPVLAYPDPNATFILDTDASDVGIGAVLSQEVDGDERVVAYGSRVLTKQERRYCVTRRELLAVVHFVKAYRHFLTGKPFLVRTDHAALQWLRNFKEPEGQIARWLETLGAYNFSLLHRPGKKHGNADAMSRGPCPQCQGDHQGEKIRAGRKKKPEVAGAVTTRGMTKTTTQNETTSNWLDSSQLSKERIREEQRSDPVVAEVAKWVQEGERPNFGVISPEGPELKFYWGQFTSLKVQDGILVRELNQTALPVKRQILVPPSLREEVLEQCHDVLTAGHLGRAKTMANVKRRFVWPGMRRDVELHVKTCGVCAQYKSDGRQRKAALKDHRVGIPMERVCVDIVGPFPTSSRGHKYGLVVTDCFTKFVEIYPMENQEASTVARIMTREFFSRYGVPIFLHSDQGTQFESKLFADVCELLGIAKTRTTPFHPQSDGQSERNIKTLTRMIAMVTEEQHEWDEHLPFIAMAYRATPQASTGVTPNYMMFGRELSMPVDVMVPLDGEETRTSTLEHVKQLRNRLTPTPWRDAA